MTDLLKREEIDQKISRVITYLSSFEEGNLIAIAEINECLNYIGKLSYWD
ncbi:MAG TPA: hypothetical protein PKW55_05255 [Spirochaetota bacterium]|nr:hypothetical protein [Spirochaetota bacterium]HOM37641.1 hypothetical protein [Spirochaetota bacterium]HPQ49388.1 hypothetical protein [Spirochaetota bacterium]